jgi:integrase/recombinase XerD
MRKWGGVSFDRRRGKYRVYIPWKGKREWIAQDRHGYKISCEDHAMDVLREIRIEHFSSKFDPSEWGKDKTILVENAWVVYQDQAQCGRLRHDQRQQQFDAMILSYFGGKTLKEIEEHHLWDWFSKIPKYYAAPTVKGFLNTLRGFFNFYKITRQKAFKWPRVPMENKKQAWIEEDEQERVLEAVPTQHKPIIRFLIQYGCRVSEACNLKRTDIDWGKRVLVFRDRKNLKDNELPIMPNVEKDLVGGGDSPGIPPSNQKRRETKVHPPTNLFYVFSTPSGKHYQRQHVGQIWEKACKRAGVRHISLKNGTRHSKASQLINRDVSTAIIARVLGNSERVVEANYANLTVKKVAGILGNSSPSVHNGH